ncbi:kinase/pyrophosphorylase [Parasulfuritortus cantonensis]|uniref:Putative phosphoenolpyruvate synthase regulatory protein n=1 Tax=Parasulfuritortus cantonensis TaxID=2528202 RepID=A0A4R1BM67_9PROT|nr:pyruvate, water dikinase regulatory protein [Parasulfuritortus cantonensis]TCJ18495.1 kinase/pyrophosphorylase [Parasulfuritortus cantonensis]
MNPTRSVFIVSDHTGITAEILGKSLLCQFPGEAFATESLPFVDTLDKVEDAAKRIREAWQASGMRPLVFSTMTDDDARAILDSTGAMIMDVFAHFIGLMTKELGRPAIHLKGQSHSASNETAYHERIDAVNFSLAADDGLATQKYEQADLILVGVSRSGKTPTSLYMAMQYGLKVANYPLTPENFEKHSLPATIRPYKRKLRGLTLTPERLSAIRSERRPNSEYAAMDTCKRELDLATQMMAEAGIPVLDSSTRSIEEISAILRQSLVKGGR